MTHPVAKISNFHHKTSMLTVVDGIIIYKQNIK